MNKKGFILIETITMFLVLISALTLFYVSASGVLSKQKEYTYYDDIATTYAAHSIKQALLDFSKLSQNYDELLLEHMYLRNIGIKTDNLFFDSEITNFTTILDNLNVHQIFITNNIDELKACAIDLEYSFNCINTYMTEEMRSYIKTINVGDLITDYYLIVELRMDANGKSCDNNGCLSSFSWVSL